VEAVARVGGVCVCVLGGGGGDEGRRGRDGGPK
jgi:hypothetical protein